MTMTRAEAAACWEANAETWTRHARAGFDVYRDHLNTPAFLAMLPPVAGLRGLDIGCGEGGNTRAVARLGAHVTALDLSPDVGPPSADRRGKSRPLPPGIAPDAPAAYSCDRSPSGSMEAIVSAAVEYDRAAPRRSVSLSINEDLLSQAEALTPNLSGTVEELLAGYVQREQDQRQAEDGRLDAVISALNAFHDRHGFLSDEFCNL